MWAQTTLVNLLSCLAFSLLCVFLYIQYKFSYWRRRYVPYEYPEFPLGYMWAVLTKKKHFTSMYNLIYKRHPKKRYVGIYTLFWPNLFIRDPHIVKGILITNYDDFTTRVLLNTEIDPYTESILSMDGNDVKWKTVRNTVNEAFSMGKVRNMFKLMLHSSKELVSYLKKYSDKGEPVGLREVTSMFALDVFGAVAFGVQCNSFHTLWNPYRAITLETFAPKSYKTYFWMIISALAPDLITLLRRKYFDPKVIEFHTNLWQQMSMERQTNSHKRKDLVDGLLQLMWKPDERVDKADRSRFNKVEIISSAIAIMSAGYESSASMLSFAFYELSLNSNIQEKARDEVQRVLKQHGSITYEAVLEMKYLGAIIDETLRMYPSVPFLSRKSNRECNLPNTDLVLEKGTRLIIPTTALLRDPHIFPEPDKFDPERELSDVGKMLMSLPFGCGPRNCPGKRFSLIEGRVAIAQVLNTYRIRPAPNTPREIIPEPTSITYLSKHPTWAIIEELQTCN